MANGAGGLIILGVKANSQDMPEGWPRLSRDSLRAQALQSSVRGFVEPYVPIEVAVAHDPSAPPEMSDVVVARVPLVADKPVFVSGRGVLVREGEANVPASIAQLERWLTRRSDERTARAGRIGTMVGSLTTAPAPQLGIAVWMAVEPQRVRWNDDTDAQIVALTSQQFTDMSGPQISEGRLYFKVPTHSSDEDRAVIVESGGAVVRRADLPSRHSEMEVNAVHVAGQMLRTWKLAVRVFAAIAPDDTGPLSFSIALGGLRGGLFTTVPVMTQLPERRDGGDRAGHWRAYLTDLPRDADEFDLVGGLMERLLRNCGYSPVSQVAREITFIGQFGDGNLPTATAEP